MLNLRSVALVLGMFVTACGGGGSGNPAAPSNGVPSNAVPNAAIMVMLNAYAPTPPFQSSVTATIDGSTSLSEGINILNLTTGVHIVTGSYHGYDLDISFGSAGQGGLRNGSLQSIAGPAPQVVDCTITYRNPASTAATSNTFRFQFQHTTVASEICK